MFKVSAVVLAFCLAISVMGGTIDKIPAEMRDVVMTLHNTCKDEVGVADDLITKAQEGDFADDNNLKCYTKCLADNFGVLEDDGTLDVEGLVAVIPPGFEAFAAAVKKCGTQKGSDVCDTVFQTFKCYYTENPDSFFLP